MGQASFLPLKLSNKTISSFAQEDISKLVKSGKEVIVVTSGAVGLGKKKLKLNSTEGDGVKQACAAVGQSRLMSYYEAGFATFDIPIAQILLTEDDFDLPERFVEPCSWSETQWWFNAGGTGCT